MVCVRAVLGSTPGIVPEIERFFLSVSFSRGQVAWDWPGPSSFMEGSGWHKVPESEPKVAQKARKMCCGLCIS